MIRKRVLVSGWVQGVAYRDSCRRTAQRYGVSGWVRNRLDGRVEAVFEGEPGSVQRLTAWARQGPPAARVEEMQEFEEEPEGLTGFEVLLRG
jgi:acylphosphatase